MQPRWVQTEEKARNPSGTLITKARCSVSSRTDPTAIPSGGPALKVVAGSKRTLGLRKSAETAAAPPAAMAQAVNPAVWQNRRRVIPGSEGFSSSGIGRLPDQKLLHRDGPGGATLRAQTAADADRLVLDQDGPARLARLEERIARLAVLG